MQRLSSLFFVLFISGCGGGGSSSGVPTTNPTPVSDPVPAPKNVTASVAGSNITLNWNEVEGSTDYNLYYSTEKGLEPSNYAAYEGGTWVQNVVPPVSIPISDMKAVYHFVVSANKDSREGKYSPAVIAVPRYVPSTTPGWVLDRANNFEWSRCPYGQTYSAENHTCTGSAIRMGYSSARAAATSESAEVPVAEFISTITFCSSGDPSYFPGEQGCTASSRSPAVYEPAFPHSSTDIDSYITATYCTVDTLQLVTFGGGHHGVCAGPPDSLVVNLRLLKRP